MPDNVLGVTFGHLKCQFGAPHSWHHPKEPMRQIGTSSARNQKQKALIYFNTTPLELSFGHSNWQFGT